MSLGTIKLFHKTTGASVNVGRDQKAQFMKLGYHDDAEKAEKAAVKFAEAEKAKATEGK